jgi:gas vesicle protein
MNKNAKILAALLGGVAIGAAIGFLLAPGKGSETRKKVADAAKKFGEKATEKAREGMKMASGFSSKVNGEAEDLGI